MKTTDEAQAATNLKGTVPARLPRRLVLIAVGIAVLAFLAVSIGGIGKNLVYYWGPSQLRAAGPKAVGANIRLGGLVVQGSLVRHSGSALEFDVVDTGAKVHVKSTGVPPQMFREGIGVVVEGTFTRDGYFEGQRLLVSHGNEYRAPGEHANVDAERLIRGTQGLSEGR